MTVRTLQARPRYSRRPVCWDRALPAGADDAWTDGSNADDTEAVYDALVLGTRDYVRKCGFNTAIIGMSGGIDSALTTVIATEALGASNVTGVAMPGPHSSDGSLLDARRTAEAMGIRFLTIGINPAYQAFGRTGTRLESFAPNIAEKTYSRLRGTTLRALGPTNSTGLVSPRPRASWQWLRTLRRYVRRLAGISDVLKR